jgi:hypothetical protein
MKKLILFVAFILLGPGFFSSVLSAETIFLECISSDERVFFRFKPDPPSLERLLTPNSDADSVSLTKRLKAGFGAPWLALRVDYIDSAVLKASLMVRRDYGKWSLDQTWTFNRITGKAIGRLNTELQGHRVVSNYPFECKKFSNTPKF